MHPADGSDARGVYASVWRWHFYAGLFVAPFLVLLALTGLAMLYRDALDRWQFGSFVSTPTPVGPVAHQVQLDAARDALPGSVILRYEPFPAPAAATRVSAAVDGRPHTIYVDSGTGRVCGLVADEDRLAFLAERIHGTLLVGEVGDRLIEIAAGLGIALLLSGLYLWFPRSGRSRTGGRRRGWGRLAWRNAHGWLGAVLAPTLLFYLVSGLAWTGIWGGRYVQAWNTYPAEKFTPSPAAELSPTHEVLNGLGMKTVPWNLEQTALPRSANDRGVPLSLDDVIALAKRAGIGSRYWVGLPDGPRGVWTVAQTAFDGNIHDPREELTVHIDQYTGAVRGRVAFGDYAWGAKAMAAGIPLHKGHLGRWSVAAATVVCVTVILLTASGLAVWWTRRPARGWRLAAPPKPANVRLPLAVWGTLTVLAVAFPLLALTFAGAAILDRVIRRLPRVAQLLD